MLLLLQQPVTARFRRVEAGRRRSGIQPGPPPFFCAHALTDSDTLSLDQRSIPALPRAWQNNLILGHGGGVRWCSSGAASFACSGSRRSRLAVRFDFMVSGARRRDNALAAPQAPAREAKVTRDLLSQARNPLCTSPTEHPVRRGARRAPPRLSVRSDRRLLAPPVVGVTRRELSGLGCGEPGRHMRSSTGTAVRAPDQRRCGRHAVGGLGAERFGAAAGTGLS